MLTENIGNIHIIPDVLLSLHDLRRTTRNAGLHIVEAPSYYCRVFVLTIVEPLSRYGRASVSL